MAFLPNSCCLYLQTVISQIQQMHTNLKDRNQFLQQIFTIDTYYLLIIQGQEHMHTNKKVHKGSDDEDSDDEQYTNENGTIGFQFADVGKQSNRKVLKLSPYNPKLQHRTVCNGLNLQGICRNQGCKVFEKAVWVQKGFGQFRIGEQIDNALCPICKKQLPSQTVRSLGYSEAKVKVVGRKHGENKRFEWADSQTQGELVKFEGYDGKSVHWSFLNLFVTKL